MPAPEKTVTFSGASLALISEAALLHGVDFHEAIVQAVHFYAWVLKHQAEGKELWLIDPKTHKYSTVKLGRVRDAQNGSGEG